MKGFFMGILLITVLYGAAIAETDKDIKGSRDQEVVSKVPDSKIKVWTHREMSSYLLPLGKIIKDRAVNKKLPMSKRVIEGSVTRITYFCPPSTTPEKIYRRYQQELKERSFTRIFYGHGLELEEKNNYWNSVVYKNYQGLHHLKGTPSNHWYISGYRKSGDIYTVVTINISKGKYKWPVTHIDVIVCRPEPDKVKLDSDIIRIELKEHGHLAIEGYIFNYNSADIKPEHEILFSKVAGFMKKNPSMKFYIVGHANVGPLHYNLELSGKMAESVVKILTDKYSIDKSRLSAHGVGNLAPVTSNSTKEGKEENRRVEIVLR